MRYKQQVETATDRAYAVLSRVLNEINSNKPFDQNYLKQQLNDAVRQLAKAREHIRLEHED